MSEQAKRHSVAVTAIAVFVVATAFMMVDTRLAIGRIGDSVEKLNAGLARIERRFSEGELARWAGNE